MSATHYIAGLPIDADTRLSVEIEILEKIAAGEGHDLCVIHGRDIETDGGLMEILELHDLEIDYVLPFAVFVDDMMKLTGARIAEEITKRQRDNNG